MKKECFENVMERVCSAMEVSRDDVLRSNKEECVDARYLAIALLSERLSDRQISEVSGWSVQLVNKARNCFHERCRFRWGLKELYLKIKQTIFF